MQTIVLGVLGLRDPALARPISSSASSSTHSRVRWQPLSQRLRLRASDSEKGRSSPSAGRSGPHRFCVSNLVPCRPRTGYAGSLSSGPRIPRAGHWLGRDEVLGNGIFAIAKDSSLRRECHICIPRASLISASDPPPTCMHFPACSSTSRSTPRGCA